MGHSGLKRIGNEKFYTKAEVVRDCINELIKINKLEGSTIIEPSAGSGSFTEELGKIKGIGQILAYDILPEQNRNTVVPIKKQDFLQLDTTSLKNSIVIGNPPFGRQASLAKKFVKKCCEFAHTIAFILPRSFKKESMQGCFTLHYHKVFEKDLQFNAFTINDQDYSVPCVFQIWQYKEEQRNKVIKYICDDSFKFVKNYKEATFAFRRVGGKAGTVVFENLQDLSLQSHYFISVTKEGIFSKDKLQSMKFDEDNTTGPKSISKQELIKKLLNF
jgi:predicted RNA methylase